MTQIKFYKETEFKKTEIGEIPREWEVRRLGGEICDINPSYKIKRGEIYKFLPMEAVNGDFYRVKFYIEKEWNGSGVKFSYGDVLLARITPSAENGKTTIIDFLDKDEYGIGSTEFIVFKPKEADSFFIYYILKWDKVRSQLINQMTGTTGRQRIPNSAPYRIKIPLPPLSEQKAIAQVLKNFDDLIEVMEEKIKTLQRIKKGLMEVYFTRGVFEHKEFKDTEIGRIPKEWEVKRLGDKNFFGITMGQSPPSSSYNTNNKGMPFLQGSAEFGLMHPKHVKYTSKPLKIAYKDSILLSVRAPVGDVNIADKDYCIGRGLASIKVKRGEDLFFFYLFQHLKKTLENVGGGSTFKAISKQQLENLLIPLLPLEEQKAIAERLKTIDDQIGNLKSQKESLQKIKKKFMDLLLTGKVRVKEIKEGAEK